MPDKLSPWQVLRYSWCFICDDKRLILLTPFFALIVADGARDAYLDVLWSGVELSWGPRWYHGMCEGDLIHRHTRRWTRGVPVTLWSLYIKAEARRAERNRVWREVVDGGTSIQETFIYGR